MNYSAAQQHQMAEHPQPEADTAPSPHEIKYRHDAVCYIAAMLTELRQIAGKAGFDKIVTALDSAYYEAYGATRAKPAPAETGNEPGHQEKTFPEMEQTGT